MQVHHNIQVENDVLFERKLAVFTDHDIHTHDALEVSVLLENEAIYRLSHQDYCGKPGDVFIFRPFEPHWTLVKERTKPVRWLMILFAPSVVRLIPDGFKMLAPFYSVDGFSPLISGDSVYARQIRDSALCAISEQEKGLPGWQAKQYVLVIDILIALYRCYLESAKERPGNNELEAGIIRAIEYILRHYREEIDSDWLIRLSDLKKTWFYHKFHEVTRLTPNAFITRLRLQHASHLLRHSSQSITEIAFESGFNSLSYFNRAFKLYKGTSPSEYRINESRL